MSASKVLALLDLFNEERKSLTVEEMSHLLSLPRSSVYRHVRLLKESGFLKEDRKGEYKLGYKILEMANIVKEDESIVDVAFPFMHELTKEFKETTILSVRSSLHVVCLATVTSNQLVKVSSEQGKILPLYSGASSKVILAYQDDDVIEELFTKGTIEAFTNNTPTTRESIEKNLIAIRSNGYSETDSEVDEGVYAFGFPIKYAKKRVFASLAIAGPKERMLRIDREKLIHRFALSVKEIEKFL